MWNTSYKTKSEDFRKIFKDVNREDRLLVGKKGLENYFKKYISNTVNVKFDN